MEHFAIQRREEVSGRAPTRSSRPAARWTVGAPAVRPEPFEHGTTRPLDELILRSSAEVGATRIVASAAATRLGPRGASPTRIQRTLVHNGNALATPAHRERRNALMDMVKPVFSSVAPQEWLRTLIAFEKAEKDTAAHEFTTWFEGRLKELGVTLDRNDTLPRGLARATVADLFRRLEAGEFDQPVAAPMDVEPPVQPTNVPKRGQKRKRGTGADADTDTGGDAGDGTGEKAPKKARTFKDDLVDELVGLRWSKFGGTMNLVLFKPLPATATGPQLGAGRANEIHQGSPSVIGPQSYKGDKRTRQAMRWLSTIALRLLNNEGVDPREVQAALTKGRIYIASNTKTSLNQLNRQLAGKTGLAAVQAMIEAIETTGGLSTREQRHIAKSRKRLLAGNPGDNFEPIRAALGKDGAFVVCMIGGKSLHAERRIKKELGADFDTSKLGGVKRPCLACKLDLYGAANPVRSGPYWPSIDSNVEMPNYQAENAKAMATQVNAVAATYVTQVNESSTLGVTHEYDTDSDSDAD